MKKLQIQKQVQFQQASNLKPFWEKVEWSYEVFGGTIRLITKIRNIETYCMFQIKEWGETQADQEAYFRDQLQKMQDQTVERLEFIYVNKTKEKSNQWNLSITS